MIDLKALEQQYVSAINELNPKGNVYEYLLRKTLESRLERLRRIQSLSMVETFDVVFIGKVGAGKTTAICHLFELTGEFERGKPPRKRTEPLLTTGGGRVSICEVVLGRAERTAIRIEPYDAEEMRKLLEDFTDSIFARLEPQNYEKPTEGLSAELDRAIRNIVALNVVERDGKKVDPATERARETGEKVAFLQALLAVAKIEERTETLATFVEGDERQWLQETFKEINVGRRQGFSIPRRIHVQLASTFFKYELPSFIGRVVDTKGLDEITVRNDIDSYIERDDAVCLFTSGFADAPDAAVLNYVQRHLENTSLRFDLRCVLLALPRHGESASVLDPEGNAVGDETEGQLIKANQAMLAFQNRGLPFHLDNITFYDALRGYSGNVLTDVEIVNADRVKFFEQLKRVVAHRQARLAEDAEALQRELAELKASDTTLRPEDDRIIQDVRALLRQSRVEARGDDYVFRLMTFMRANRRPIQFHALNRRFGVHEASQTNLFDIAKVQARSLVREATLSEFKRVQLGLQNVCQQASESNSDTFLFLQELEKQLQIKYDGYLDYVAAEVRVAVTSLLEPCGMENPFWQAVKGQWGKGAGYWERVSNCYADELSSIGETIQDTAKNGWMERVTHPLAEFLAAD